MWPDPRSRRGVIDAYTASDKRPAPKGSVHTRLRIECAQMLLRDHEFLVTLACTCMCTCMCMVTMHACTNGRVLSFSGWLSANMNTHVIELANDIAVALI